MALHAADPVRRRRDGRPGAGARQGGAGRQLRRPDPPGPARAAHGRRATLALSRAAVAKALGAPRDLTGAELDAFLDRLAERARRRRAACAP